MSAQGVQQATDARKEELAEALKEVRHNVESAVSTGVVILFHLDCDDFDDYSVRTAQPLCPRPA